MTPADDPDVNHPDAMLLALYADARVTADERRQVETHLADCALCRAQVAAGRGVGRPATGIGRSARWGVAAAALLAVTYGAYRVSRLPPEIRTERGEVGEARPARIATTIPGPDSAVRTDSVTFAWRARAEVISYRLTVLAEDGTAVWSTVTSDTTIGLPADRMLVPGAQYFWIVDGLLRDGKSATSGSVKFFVRSP